MLTISDTRPTRTCQGVSRREFLRIGGLTLGGVTLPQLAGVRASDSKAHPYINDLSVVMLFLSGGPSHIEFFDPKMSAPSEIRSITGELKTRTPGVTFGGTFPKLAAMTDRFSIVRSYGSKNSGHTYGKVASGDNPLKAAMSAIYARVAGVTDPSTGIPNNILVKPEAIVDGLKLKGNFETGALPTLTDAGPLGKTYSAFDSSGGGALMNNMSLSLPAERFGDRRSLLQRLDRMRYRLDGGGVLDRADGYRRQAYDIITRGIVNAFDLSKEDPKVVSRYDTTAVFNAPDLQRYGDMRRATNLLGHQMLMARRLCEAGCGFVTVSDCGWDMHANGNSPKNMTGIWPMGQQVDHAVSVFIDDVHQRGLDKNILLIVTGEMGRTPRINKNGGRDHYGELTPLLLAGGPLNMGHVVGASSHDASKPVGSGYTPQHLFGTVMHSLFNVGQLRLDPSIPSDLSKVITDSRPITPLHG